MEFFSFSQCSSTEQELQQLLTIDTLNSWCPFHVDKILSHQDNSGEIYCIWGQFHIQRELIYGGVRFSLLNCRNAVTWSITTCPRYRPDEIVVHCTINRTEQDTDFTDTIESFVEEWRQALESQFS
ncbi:MAG: hypothetical protein GXP22_10595 [Gammaproteobacteria bacterium]|nr:hypothetical protein [Gammaproteobacteria bacterium]